MSDYLQQIIKISSADYQTLCTNGTVTYNGVTLTGPNNDCLYITNDRIVPMDLDNSFILPVNKGGTNITSYSAGDILYASGATALVKLSGNTTTTNKFLRSVATTDGIAEAPSWERLAISDIPNGIARGNGRVFYGTCTTAADTAEKAVTCTAYDALTTGDIIVVSFDNTNTATASDLTLNVNGKGARNIKRLYNYALNSLQAKAELHKDTLGIFMYTGTYWILINADYNSTYTTTYVWCNTAAGTAAKTFSAASYYTANDKSFFEITFRYGNTAASALTLNDKTLYINGSASSSSNYTLPAGKYLVYYDDDKYYIRTDGKLTADITGTANTATNLAAKPSFATSGTTQITLTAGGKTSDAFTVPYATTANAPVWIDFSTVSSLPVTVNNAAITSNHKAVNWVIGTDNAFYGDITATTTDGSVTLSGLMASNTASSTLQVLFMIT